MIGGVGEKFASFAMTLFAIFSLILSRIVLMRTPEVQKLP
jgi:hypothetical protein